MAAQNDHHVDVLQRRTRERRVWQWAFIGSLLLHALLLLIGPLGSIPLSPYAAAGPDAGDDLAAEGLLELVTLSSAPPDALQPPPVPVLDFDLPQPEAVSPESVLEMSDLDVPEPGTGLTDGTDLEEELDAGAPGAVGAGADGTVAEGRSRVVPPSPRGIILPPTSQALRGRVIEVWVFVSENGRVVPDSTQLRPPTTDAGFNEQLIQEAAQWVFAPAREDGSPVASWFPYTISME